MTEKTRAKGLLNKMFGAKSKETMQGGFTVMGNDEYKDTDSGYYDIGPLMSKNATYSLAIGKRGNGKTFSALKYALEQYAVDKSTSAYIRRWKDDVTGARASTIFSDLNSKGIVKSITGYDAVSYYNRIQYLSEIDEETGKVKRITPLMYMFSLSDMEHDKSTQYPTVKTIIFDEFIARNGYFPDEFIAFTNTLSTIIRDRDNCRVIMLGNTISKFCPYFQEMGLKKVYSMQQNTIDVYQYGNTKLTVAVEYTGENEASNKSNFYFAFENPKLEMITKGKWELPVFPHTLERITQENVLFSYFILFSEKVFQADIVNGNNGLYTHIHEKTTPIQDEQNDLIYCLETKEGVNYYRNILKPDIEIRRKVASFFSSGKVFYSNNDVGSYIQSYLRECVRNAY